MIKINLLTIENITKSYGERNLFENVELTITDSNKIGLIGINGTGKSTLLKIIVGLEIPDTGQISYKKDISIQYLSQNPTYENNPTIIEHIFNGNSDSLSIIRDYEVTQNSLEVDPNNQALQDRLYRLTETINNNDLWDYENQVKTILTKLGIKNFHQKMNTLSGGQKKRVALANVLISTCDLLVLDEPTNHMDNDTIDWLETYLKNRHGALLMITHDRYFLDRVVNKTIELDHGKLYSYKGNYSYFVEKKIERQALENSLEQKRKNLYKKELAWMKKGAKARTTKQKARIQRFEEIQNNEPSETADKLSISVGHSRLGGKVIEINNIYKGYPDKSLIEDFSYILLRDDRIGIIGNNGIGKSTLLKIITGSLSPDKGSIDVGSTVKIGYFSQESEYMDESMRAIEYIREISEFVETKEGTKTSAASLMETFLFNKDLQWNTISRLSGGEKRRLFLLKILMTEPNILILDEPTNDFDLDTLKVLENYLDDFNGAVISVSHDRYFLDRTCNRIFSFEGKGNIIEHTGNYSDYLHHKKTYLIDTSDIYNKKTDSAKNTKQNLQKTKLSYKEKKELEQIPKEITIIEEKLSVLEEKINLCTSDFIQLNELVTEKNNLEEEMLINLEREEYLLNFEQLKKESH